MNIGYLPSVAFNGLHAFSMAVFLLFFRSFLIYFLFFHLFLCLFCFPFHSSSARSLLIYLDTFASKVAAIQDKYADASVGNVTGSNAVNVFLGIGVAWTIGMYRFHTHFFSNLHFRLPLYFYSRFSLTLCVCIYVPESV